MTAYLAGSIFYYGDVLRNTEWAAKIREAIPGIDLYSPIENTAINGAEGKKWYHDGNVKCLIHGECPKGFVPGYLRGELFLKKEELKEYLENKEE